jgi:hypothetical protein
VENDHFDRLHLAANLHGAALRTVCSRGFRATVGNGWDGLAAAAPLLGPSGCSGGQVFLNVAVYFDVAWTTMVWIADPRSDQDMNAYDRFPMVWLEAPIVWVEF